MEPLVIRNVVENIKTPSVTTIWMFTSLVEWSEGKEYSYRYNISWKRVNKDEFMTSSVETMGRMDCISNVHHTTSCIFVLGTKVVLGVHEYVLQSVREGR